MNKTSLSQREECCMEREESMCLPSNKILALLPSWALDMGWEGKDSADKLELGWTIPWEKFSIKFTHSSSRECTTQWILSSSNSFCCSRCWPKHNHASGWNICWEKQLFEGNVVGALLGSSVTPAAHGRHHCSAIPCLCWCGLIHKSSRKICCGLCWILINVFRVTQQVTTLDKFTLLLIVAVFPALCENCFLLFHLPECICGCAVLTG